MKKIKHRPDFEPFALVIETEDDKSDFMHLIEMANMHLAERSRSAHVARRLQALIDGPCDD